MRIDSSLYSDVSIEIGQSNRSSGTFKTRADAPRASSENDTAVFSVSDDKVRILESEIDGSTDVREDRVAALRSSIDNNEYFVSPEKIADAIYREIASSPLSSQKK